MDVESPAQAGALYQAMVDQTSQFIGLLDLDGVLICANRTALDFAGVRQAEVQGQPFWETAWWSHSPQLQQQLRDAIRDAAAGEPVRFLATHLAHDGAAHQIDFKLKPLRDEAGAVSMLVADGNDLTERSIVDQGHLDHLRFLQQMDRVDRAITGAADVQQLLQGVMETVFEIFGCDRAWLLYPCDPGAPSFSVPMEVTRPEHPGALEMNLEVPMVPDYARDCQRALDAEDPIVCTDGTEHPVNQQTVEQFGVLAQIFTAIYPKVGSPWLFGMHQCSYPRLWSDEDRRLCKEIGRRIADGLSSLLFLRDLQHSEQRFRSLLANTPGAVFRWELNPQWTTLFVSDYIQQITGYPASDFIDNRVRTHASVIHPEDRERVEQTLRQALRSGAPHAMEYRIVDDSGAVRWVDLRGQGFGAAQGQGVGLDGAIFDVTERKQAEHELAQHREHLEELVAQRTAELGQTNQQLVEANAELESFAYSVSHDLRAPLRIIDGFSKLILQRYSGELDDKGQEFLELIRDNTRDMGQLIDDLLAFSHLGRREMLRTEIDMAKLVREVFAECTALVPERAIRLQVGALPAARGDAAMVRQVVVNLLSNAVKFTDRQPAAVIEVSGRVEGDHNLYQVKDNGVGFDPQHAERIFGVFQRLHRAEEFEGTGIGLALVQRIIQRHGGEGWAEGQPGQGATLSFTLPL